MRWLLAAVASALCAAAVWVPSKEPRGGEPGNVYQEVLLDLIQYGQPGGILLGVVVGVGLFLPVVAAFLVPLPARDPGGRRSLIRVVGLFTMLLGLVLVGAIGLTLAVFSFSGGTWDHNALATIIPAFYFVAGLATFVSSYRRVGR